jgi:hexokinase
MEKITLSRYVIESPEEGLYEVRDTKTNVFVTFKEKQFKETQEWYFPADPAIQKPITMNRIADKLEAWLMLAHPDLMSEPEKFVMKISDDGKTITIDRPKLGFTLSFPAKFGKAKAASIIRSTSEWLKRYEGNWDNVDF